MDEQARGRHVEFEDDDFDLVLLRASETNTRAYTLLYRRHAAAVLRYAWTIAGTEAEALDLVQETFATLWAKRTNVNVVDESLLPWLLSVCRNHGLHLDRWRRRHDAVPLETADQFASDADRLSDWMTDAFAVLTPVDRRLCELCLLDGFTYREAARLLSLSEAAVGKRLERARIKLRKAALNDD